MKHRLWCNGDCVWKNKGLFGECVRKSNKKQVNCGGHSADSCADCPKVKYFRIVRQKDKKTKKTKRDKRAYWLASASNRIRSQAGGGNHLFSGLNPQTNPKLKPIER